MAEEDLDPVSISALALLQELVNQMPAIEGTELWSKEGTSVQSRRDLDHGRFELVIDGHPAVIVDLWPLLTPPSVEPPVRESE